MGSKRLSVVSGVVGISSLALTAFGIITPAAADPFDDALRAYSSWVDGSINADRVSAAIDQWEKNARAGDILSRHVLGDIFSNRAIFTPVAGDEKLNIPLPEEAGIVPDADNMVQALAWYTIAATHRFEDYGQEPTFREINARYDARERIPQLKKNMTDEQVYAAEDMVVRIMSEGSPFDLYRLGTMFQSGDGLPKDNVQALKYYQVAINRSSVANTDAARAVGYLRSIMTEEDIKVARNHSDEWQPPLPDTFTAMTPRDFERQRQLDALREAEAARAMVSIEKEFNDRNEHIIQTALASLGLYLGEIDGTVGPQTRAAMGRFQYLLVEDDESMSESEKRDTVTGVLTGMQKVALIERAAEVNHPQSAYILGIVYAQGIGKRIDGEEARYWLEKSASFGYPLAHYALGRYYRDGIFGENPLEPSKSKASYHFGQAAALGIDQAQEELVEMNYEFNFAHD